MARGPDDIDQIATLKGLSTTLVDSIHGYRYAYDNDIQGNFRDFFQERADEREQVLKILREAVVELGGTPDDEASFLGKAHRQWLGLKSVLFAHDVKAIFNEVERGERFLKQNFETALDNERLSGSARLAVQRAYQAVRQGHEDICQVRLEIE